MESKFPLLEIKNLSIEFNVGNSFVKAIDNVFFDIPKGKTVGIVGESGAGKSITSLAIMGLLPRRQSHISRGEIHFCGKNLLETTEANWRKIRGNEISMIFQEPMTSLNPVLRIGAQIEEVLGVHGKLRKNEMKSKVIELLSEVGIKNPERRYRSYPHELSGGQRQRVMIAMSIACQPKLLIADEPTTALDVTTQQQILKLLLSLQKKYGMSILFITHDLAVVGDIADQVVVMYQGKVVEQGEVAQIFSAPRHPYTKGLMSCRPNLDEPTRRLATVSHFMTSDGEEREFDSRALGAKQLKSKVEDVVLEAKNISKYYSQKNGMFRSSSQIKAVDDVSFKIYRGRTLGVVGESGCGKTTLGRSLLRLLEPTGGQIYFEGCDITHIDNKSMMRLRKKMQVVFQDPYASLNPRMMVGPALIEPMKIHGIGSSRAERWERAEYLMEKVGLESSHLRRYPHEFSGGQRQRICIARALSVEPSFIICDESVSALDMSVQAQTLNLLLDLQDEFDLTYMFISHDLSVVRFFSDEVAVMKEGRIIESGSAEDIYKHPENTYTKELLKAIPKGFNLSKC